MERNSSVSLVRILSSKRPTTTWQGVDQLAGKASIEERHAKKKVEIEVGTIAICMERLGEERVSEVGPLGVENQGDDLGLYTLAR